MDSMMQTFYLNNFEGVRLAGEIDSGGLKLRNNILKHLSVFDMEQKLGQEKDIEANYTAYLKSIDEFTGASRSQREKELAKIVESDSRNIKVILILFSRIQDRIRQRRLMIL